MRTRSASSGSELTDTRSGQTGACGFAPVAPSSGLDAGGGAEQGGCMNEGEGAETMRGGGNQAAHVVVPFPSVAPKIQVTFGRDELTTILNLYGRMVAAGEWRDYAISFERDRAVFSVYRRSSEMPLYRVVKEPALARRQGAYSVVAATGHVLKRGPELRRVLGVMEGPLKVVPN